MYGAVPPAAETVTVALPPLQLMGVVTLAEALSEAGWFTVTLAVLLQPFASVMVKEYVPAARVKEPVPVYGAVPPAAETVTVALPPLQLMGVVTLAEALSDAGWFTVTLAVLLQPFASVMVKEYVPAARVKEPVPMYGAVPPAAETATVALPPLQLMGVVTLAEAEGELRTVMGAVVVKAGHVPAGIV